MKKLIFLTLVSVSMLFAYQTSEAACTCDASTKYKCSGEDSKGNKCKGTGAAKVSAFPGLENEVETISTAS